MGLAVERVDVRCTLAYGLGGIALEVDKLTIDDNLVAHLDLVGRSKLHIAQIVALEDKNLSVLGAVVRDIVVGVAECGSLYAVDLGNLTLYIEGVLCRNVGRQSADQLEGCSHVVGALQGTLTFGSAGGDR